MRPRQSSPDDFIFHAGPNVFRRRGGFSFADAEDIDPDELFRHFFFFSDMSMFQQQQQQQYHPFQRRYHQHRQQEQEQDPSVALCFRLVVLVGIFALVSMLSTAFSTQLVATEPPFSLRRVGDYSVERTSAALGQRYFVKPNYPASKLAEIDREVDIQWLKQLVRIPHFWRCISALSPLNIFSCPQKYECDLSRVHKRNGIKYDPEACNKAQKAYTQWQRTIPA